MLVRAAISASMKVGIISSESCIHKEKKNIRFENINNKRGWTLIVN